MKNCYLLAILLFICFCYNRLAAQQVLWADSLVGFSSEYKSSDPMQYSAKQILGKPSRYPIFGSTANAWSPATINEEWIHVKYKSAIQIQQVFVSENENAGCIIRVEIFDEAGGKQTVYENLNLEKSNVKGRFSYYFFEKTKTKIKSVKITLNSRLAGGFSQLDAIGISDSKDSIKPKILLIEGSEIVIPREDLGPNINSPTTELLPQISPDGQKLFFTRQDHPQNTPPIYNQDVWVSEKDSNGVFQLAKNLGPPINNSENSSALGFSPDGQQLFLLNAYLPDGKMEKGISYSTKIGDSWGYPKEMKIKNYYNDNIYGEFNKSVSGKVIIMTIQRKDGYGSKDVYVSFLNSDSTWTEPKNCGPVLNTAESESTPFLSADEKTLYFSTNGLPGYGSKDMYMSTRLDDTWLNWSEPKNLGPNLNTPAWDAYYVFTSDGEYVYYVSYVTAGNPDIFRKKLPEGAKSKPVLLVKGKVFDSKTNKPLSSKINYYDLMGNKHVGSAISNSVTGEYSIVLPIEKKYSFYASANNYYSIGENLDLTKVTSYKVINKDLLLAPIEVGLNIRLNNLFFDFNKSELKTESFPELDRLCTLLLANPKMKIEISGHTDHVGEQASNIILSNNRSKSVLNYLVKKGIVSSRIVAKGYGKSKPLVKGTSEEAAAQNRRVEFVILEM